MLAEQTERHKEYRRRSDERLAKRAEEDPEFAAELAARRKEANRRGTARRKAHMEELKERAEIDPEAAARLAEIRAGEVRKQQEYIAKLQEQAKTVPEAAARWEAHQEYVRNYNHNCRARKQSETAGKELVTI